jgi:colanic acid/amylovoran biosynthesis protein
LKILVIHAFSPRNLGDGAITLAMIEEARRVFGESVGLSFSATEPDAFTQLLGIPAHGRLLPQRPVGRRGDRFRWLARHLPSIFLVWLGTSGGRGRMGRMTRSRLLSEWTRTAMAAYLDADIVVAAGGGYLGDPYRRALPIWHLEYRCAKAAGAPLVFYSQSVGATKHFTTKLFVGKLLRQCNLFIARDRQSLTNIAAIGSFEGKTVLCADSALLLKPPAVDGTGKTGRCVGVSLIRWDHYSNDGDRRHEAYLAGMQRAIGNLLRTDPSLRVRFYATNQAHRTNPMNDIAVLADLRDRLGREGFADRCTMAEWTSDPTKFMRDVSQCDLFVATRMHSAIMALNAGVPVTGIAYEDKMRGLLDMFELSDYVADIEQPETIPATVSRAFENREHIRLTIARVGPEVRMQAARAMELVARVASAETAQPA